MALLPRLVLTEKSCPITVLLGRFKYHHLTSKIDIVTLYDGKQLIRHFPALLNKLQSNQNESLTSYYMSLTTLSIIIPTHCKSENILKLIQAIRKHTLTLYCRLMSRLSTNDIVFLRTIRFYRLTLMLAIALRLDFSYGKYGILHD
jgi:hypothetical protein